MGPQNRHKLNSIVDERLLKSLPGLLQTLSCLLLAPVLQCPLTIILVGGLLYCIRDLESL